MKNTGLKKNKILKNKKDRLGYKKRKKFKLTIQEIQRANEMILNKLTIPLFDNDKLLLTQGLNFAVTPLWNSKIETTKWLNLQSHICRAEWNHNLLSNENNDNNQKWHNLPTKLKVLKMSSRNHVVVVGKTKVYRETVTSKLTNLKQLVDFSFKHRNNMSQNLRSSFVMLIRMGNF